MKMNIYMFFLSILLFFGCANDKDIQENNKQTINNIKEQVEDSTFNIITGAEQTEEYLPLLENKKIAVVANHTSLIKNTHLIDSLLKKGIAITKIFCPEHGFRGNADAGETINSSVDSITGLPIISLYGNHKKPYPEDMAEIDVVIFDIQDVGARFYTYISTMHYVMEACAENDKELIILDRPNPNGYYVDGPVLDTAFKSFIGMHPVPVVHGMTVGEFAKMINGEGWLGKNKQCKLTVITCKNYNHSMQYDLPVKPSPNLPNARAVYLYPSLCFFEGTTLSIGRGTDMQFQVIGHPDLKNIAEADFFFTPHSNEGAKNPKFKDVTCYGYDLRKESEIFKDKHGQLNLEYILHLYKIFPDKKNFFKNTNSFDLIAGTNELKQQIIEGKSEEEIRNSWQVKLNEFKTIRKKYLLYDD
ncbi:MAG: DUF1343 domain-containing protein [Marinilabiliales bacterium]